MPDEILSFLASGSTPGLVKPAVYDTIEVPNIENSEIRKIAQYVWTIHPTSERMVQRSSMCSWVLSWLGGSWGRLWRGISDAESCAEGGKRYTQALYLSAGFGELKNRR